MAALIVNSEDNIPEKCRYLQAAYKESEDFAKPTVCDFFLWGFVKDNVYVPPLPKTLPELRERINTAVGNVTQDMLERVRREWEYRLDICRVTRGAHIECI